MLRRDPTDLATRPIINPAPNTHPDAVPRSLPVAGPAALDPSSETGTQWTPYGVWATRPYFGGWDELSRRGHGVMHVAQARLYDASPNPWPANGVDDQPGAWYRAGLMRLRPHTSAHRGYMTPTGPGPSMLFRTPPIFGIQQVPIPAVGV